MVALPTFCESTFQMAELKRHYLSRKFLRQGVIAIGSLSHRKTRFCCFATPVARICTRWTCKILRLLHCLRTILLVVPLLRLFRHSQVQRSQTDPDLTEYDRPTSPRLSYARS